MTQAGAIPSTDGWIGREADVGRVVAALTSPDTGLIVVAPEVDGVEGLGVTAVVAAALRRPEVAARFPGGVGWLGAGGSHPEERATEFTEVLERLHGDDVELFSWLEPQDLLSAVHDEEAAGGLLREQVFTPGRHLMVVDGLRHAGQVVPLAFAVPGCTWLVTSETADTAAAGLEFAATVRVGPMTSADGAALLRRDLPALEEATAARLAELTGGWPLALTMAHGFVVSQVVTGVPATEAAARLAAGLPGRVDLADPGSRAALIGALVDRSLGWLRTVDPVAAERFLHLGLFGPGEDIPIGVAAMLWSSGGAATGGQIGALVARLEGLRLVGRRTDHPVLVLADAVKARVCELLGPDGLDRARRLLIDAEPGRTPEGWAGLPGTSEWMLRNLAGLYADAGERERLRELVCDVSWLAARIHHSGVEAALHDLTQATRTLPPPSGRDPDADVLGPSGQDPDAGLPVPSGQDPDAGRAGPFGRAGEAGPAGVLGRVLAGSAHLLERARELGVGVVPTLAARLHATPGMREEAGRWLAERGRPWLEHRWTPPDLPHEALLRTHHSRSERMTDLAMSSDGAWLAAAGDQGRVLRWSVDGTPARTLLGHEGEVTSVAAAPGGAWLASGSWDGTVRLWEHDGYPRAVLDDLPGTAEALAIAPDGTWGVACGDGFLRFWNADGTPRTAPEADDAYEEYEAVAIAPGGGWLAAVGPYVTELWNADGTRGPAVTVLRRHDEESGGTDAPPRGGAEAVAIAPSGEWLAVLSEHGTIRLLSPDGAPRAELDTVFCHGTGLAIAPGDRWLAVSDFDGNIAILDRDGTPRARLNGHTDTITGLAISPDGRLLASASGDRTVRVWDVDLAVRAGAADPPARHDVRGIAVAGDGSYLVTAGLSGLTVWNPDGTVRGRGPRQWTGSVAVAADGAYALSVDSQGRIRTHAPDGTVRRTEWPPSIGPVAEAATAIAPDGTWMAVAMDRTVRVLTRDGAVTTTLGPSDEEVTALVIAPDGTWLAAASGDEVRRWTPDGRPLGPPAEAESLVEALAVAPCGGRLAAATIEGCVELFDLAGARTARFGQDDWLTGVAFSPDGTRLATAAKHGCLRVWDVETRTTECGIVLDGELHGCAWHPDGSVLYAAGDAGLFAFTRHR